MQCKGGCVGGRHTRRHKLKGGSFYGAAVDPALGTAGLAYPAVTNNGGMNAGEIPASDISGGRRRGKGMTTKAMKKLLKKAGMKTTGKKAALTRRLKKGMRGGGGGLIPSQAASAGFTGMGTAGLISPVDVSTARAGGVVPV